MQAFEILSAGEEVRQEVRQETAKAVPVAQARPRVRRFRPLSIKDYARLLLPFLLLGALGALAKLKYPYWWPATDLVYFLADTLLVATIIGVVLELSAAKPLVEKVSENIAQRLIGRGLPAELQAPIKDIVDTGLVTDHYVKSYSFSVPEDGHINLDVEIRFEVRNYSDTLWEYAPEVSEETFWKPEFRFLEYGIAGKRIHTFADDSLFSKVETLDEIRLKRVPSSALPKVLLSPAGVDGKSACQVTWRYRLTMPEEYSDVTEFREATLGATLQLQRIPEELEFFSGGDDRLHHEPGSQSWYFDRPFIPGQHVRVWWFRKNSDLRDRYASRVSAARGTSTAR
jgi:hypothetical protein